jgi:hypothetical protein
MKKMLKALGILVLILLVLILLAGAYIKLALPNVGPAPDLKIERTAVRLERGRYLANHVMPCMTCHSMHEESFYARPIIDSTFGSGGEVFSRSGGFPGIYYAANITPAAIGSWTDGELYRAITTGVRKNGKPIFPVMPYHDFGQADPEDIRSVIVYLRSIPAIEREIPASESDFPMSFIINTIPSKANPTPLPDTANHLASGKYMFTAAACYDCHTPVNKGQFVEELALSGGREFPLPNGLLRSANITPDSLTGIGAWTKTMFVDRFKIYRDSANRARKVSEHEMQTLMPWILFAGMRDRDLENIYDYLRTVQPIRHQIVKFVPAGN